MTGSDTETTPRSSADGVFARRTIIFLGLVSLAVVVALLSHLILLIVGAVIIAVLLRGAGTLLQRLVPLPDRASVLLATALIVALLGLCGWLFGREAADQLSSLVDSLPSGWAEIKSWVSTLPFGNALAQQLQNVGEMAGSIAGQVPVIAASVAGTLADTGIALVGGVMLAMRPRSYRDGLLLLVPKPGRASARRALNATGRALRGWLIAQMISMAIIGLLTTLGLYLIGLPSALGLGLFAGLAQFVPLVGPIASAVPALLFAATLGWDMLLWTALVYIAVQQIEGNLVTPWVQASFAGIPMALTLFAIVAFGTLFGPLGVILATPLTMIGLVLVRSLYLRDYLGEDVDLPAESESDEQG